jgi:very-short-patch-repair endonuclease
VGRPELRLGLGRGARRAEAGARRGANLGPLRDLPLMTGDIAHSSAWRLVRAQHGVVTRQQLFDLGLGYRAVEHRLATGRLHAVFAGVYAVGRPDVPREGRWMAAVLACGEGAALSHESAAALWGIRDGGVRTVDVSVPGHDVRRRGIHAHRRKPMPPTTRHKNIPATQPLFTLIDLAVSLEPDPLEAAINEADKLGLVNAGSLRNELEALTPRPGLGRLKGVLDARTFAITHSKLERRFLPIARRAGLPRPETQVWLNGFRVDFYWPQLGLVVETDSLTHHRTAAQQARDRRRDQAHLAAGLTPLRLTNQQIRYAPREAEAILRAVAERSAARPQPARGAGFRHTP